MVKLGEVARVVAGGTPKTSVLEYWDGDIPWVTPKDLALSESLWINAGERFITDYGLAKSAAALLPRGTVLWSSRAPIGLVAIANNQIATNQGFKSFVPGEELDSEYLAYFLIHQRPILEMMGVGATFKEVSAKRAAEIMVPLPPLGEQKRIAEILGKTTGAISSVQKQIEQAKKLRSSIVGMASKMAVELRAISEYFDINPRQPRNIPDNAPTSFVPMANLDETFGISPIASRFSEHKKGYTYFENGDILLAKITPCFENGKSAIAKLSTQIGHGSTEFHVLRHKNHMHQDACLSPLLAAAILKQPSFLKPAENFMRGSAGQKRIPVSYIASLKVPVLKSVDLEKIDQSLEIVEALLNLYHRKLSLLQELQKSLATRAFAGLL